MTLANGRVLRAWPTPLDETDVVEDNADPDCVFCTKCNTVVANTWPVKTGPHRDRFGWCTRSVGVGVEDTRELAIEACHAALAKESKRCACALGDAA